jgi:hypothetical protein
MSRRPRVPVRLAASALCLGAVLALAGCGDATDTSQAADADPTSASTSVAAPAASEPTWPATGCDRRAASAIDYRRAPEGWKTPEEAVAHAADSSIPDVTIVVAPAGPGGSMQVWVVDDATQTILAAVSLASGPSGLYVDGVERCA